MCLYVSLCNLMFPKVVSKLYHYSSAIKSSGKDMDLTYLLARSTVSAKM